MFLFFEFNGGFHILGFPYKLPSIQLRIEQRAARKKRDGIV